MTDRSFKSRLQSMYGNSTDYPSIVDEGNVRSLQFDDRCTQSSMWIDDPNALTFGYCRAMMGFLLFQPAPRQILIIGLGGGSLSKYCYHQLPDCKVTTIEISEAVIALRDAFAIPADDERFRVVQADAAVYMRTQRATADAILLDAYDADGIPLNLCNQAFHDQCFAALRPGGVLTANIWGSDVRGSFSRLRHSFDRRVLRAKSETDDNWVAIAIKQMTLPAWSDLQMRARHWQSETGMNFTGLLEQLRLNACKSGDSWFTERG